MAIKAGTAYIDIVPNMAGFQQKLSSGVSQAAGTTSSGLSKSFSGTFGNLGTVAAGAFVGAFAAPAVFQAITGFVSDSISAASDLNESISKVNVVFEDSANGIIAWSETAAEAMGMSQQAALEAAGTYGNLFDAMGIVDVKGAEMSKTLVQLASDLASFNNANPAEVLDALRSGLVGEIEPLRKFGVNLSQARIEQKALELGLWDGVKAIDAAAKAQAAYAIIIEDTTNAQGDFARTSDGLANQQRILAAKWKDLQAQLGKELLPAMIELVDVSTELIDLLGPALGGSFKYLAFSIKIAIDQLRPFMSLMELLPGMGEESESMLNRVGDALVDNTVGRLPIVGGALSDLTKDWTGLNDAEERAAEEAEHAAREFEPLIALMGTPQWETWLAGWRDTADEFLGLTDKTNNARRELSVAIGVVDRFLSIWDPGPIEEVTEAINEQTSGLRRLHRAQLAMIDPALAVVDAFRSDADAEDELAAARRRLANLTERGITSGKKYRDAVAALDEATLGAVDSQAQLHAEVYNLADSVRAGETTLKGAVTSLRNMGKEAGLTKGEMNALVAELRAAIQGVRDYNSTPLNDKSAQITIDLITNRLNAGRMASGGIIAAASGLIARAPTVLVGEGSYATSWGKGAEAVLPLSDSVMSRLGNTIGQHIRVPVLAGTRSSKPIELKVKDWRNGIMTLEEEIDWTDWARGN